LERGKNERSSEEKKNNMSTCNVNVFEFQVNIITVIKMAQVFLEIVNYMLVSCVTWYCGWCYYISPALYTIAITYDL